MLNRAAIGVFCPPLRFLSCQSGSVAFDPLFWTGGGVQKLQLAFLSLHIMSEGMEVGLPPGTEHVFAN